MAFPWGRARLNRCPSLDNLFPNLLGSVKASGAAKIGHLKNLIWTSLAELSPGLRPISANLSRVFFFKLPQSRHPERSALQMDRVTLRLWRGVEGPRRCLIYPCCSELFDHRARHGFSSGNLIGTIHLDFKNLAQTWGWKMTTVHEKMYP